MRLSLIALIFLLAELTSCADSQRFERTDRRDWCSEVDRLAKC